MRQPKPPADPRRAETRLSHLGLAADISPCCVIGVDPGATTGVAVVWSNGDGVAHALVWSAQLGTEPDAEIVRQAAESIAVVTRQFGGMIVWAAERMVAVRGATAQANSVFGCAATEGQLYQATDSLVGLDYRHLYPAAVWRKSVSAAARSRDEAHKRVERWAAGVWEWQRPKGADPDAELVLPAIHELEALGIAVHGLRELRREAHVAALPEQARLAITTPKKRSKAKRPTGLPEHLRDRVA